MKNNTRQNINEDTFEKLNSQSAFTVIAFRYLPFWPIFVITIIISLTISYFYIKYQNPVFEANAMILLKDERSGASASPTDAALYSALGISTAAKSVENELEVLKSRTILHQVVRDMVFTPRFMKRDGFGT